MQLVKTIDEIMDITIGWRVGSMTDGTRLGVTSPWRKMYYHILSFGN